jgi:uncharacterized protein
LARTKQSPFSQSSPHAARQPGGESGNASGRKPVLRKCLVTGHSDEKSRLLRFVVGPDRQVYFDSTARLPGRGLYISPKLALVRQAAQKNLFAKAAKAHVIVPEGLDELVQVSLQQKVLEQLSLANKAGLVVAGYDKVHALLSAGKAALLIQATDGSPEQKTRMARLARGVTPGIGVFEPTDRLALGRAVGRDSAVHLAIKKGAFAARLQDKLQNFANFAEDALNNRLNQAI